MHNCVQITEDLCYIGRSDRRIALFENVYPVPRGVSYNSYLLKDEKTVLFDTVDLSVGELFFENLAFALGERALDYVVVHHMEPDHAASLLRLTERYPNVTVLASMKASQMIANFFAGIDVAVRVVKEGETVQTGRHLLRFVSAPMVHWPEVLLTFDESTGTLFSADAFGTFGALGGSIYADEVHFERDFLDDARRYYFNIVGKYGAQVQSVLKKAAGLPISMICPLHGPVWRKDIAWYLKKYLTWSAYEPEEKGVAVFYGTIYGHTQNAAEILAGAIAAEGVTNVKVYDVSVTEVSELLSEAFRYSHVVFLSATYNNGIFVKMENFLSDLAAHNYQNRGFALVENGSWAPQAGALMQERLSSLKNMRQIGEKITILSSVKEEQAELLCALAKKIAADWKEE